VFGSGTTCNVSRACNFDRNKSMSVLKKSLRLALVFFQNKYHGAESTAAVLAQPVEFLQSYETKRSLRCSQRLATGP
jgi:hypothetical protein